LPDGSVLIGNDQGDISQISYPDNSIETRLLTQAGQLTPLGLDASGCQALIREGENRLGVMDLESADSMKLIGETGGQIESAARIPGAAIIFISSSDGILEAWDLETSQRLILLPKMDSPIVELLPIQSLQCVISIHRDGTIRRWGVSAQKELIEGDVFAIPLVWGGDRVTAAAQGAGDAELMLGFGDGTIGFLDLGGEELSERFKIHSEWVTSFNLFPEGNLCLSGAFDGSLIIWDMESGNQLSRYEGHNHPIESITILPDARVAFSSTDFDLKCWDLTASEIQQQGERVTALALTPDGKKAVAASDTRYAWSRVDADTILSVLDLATGRVESRVNLGRHFWVNDLDVFSDNRRVMCACMYWQQSLMIFDLKTGRPILPLPNDRSSFSVQIDKDGSTVISGGEDSTVRIWDLDAFNEVACLQGHDDEVTAVCLYDRGTKALSASADHTLRIWDLENFQQLKVIETKAGYRPVKDIQVMDSGRFALTTGEAIQLWDLEQGVLVTSLPVKARSSLSLTWSGEENPLISGTDGRKFSVIHPTSGELIADFWGEGEGMSCSASGPDGSTFVAGGSAGAVHVLELVIPDV
jgi:WD40 repeat protein